MHLRVNFFKKLCSSVILFVGLIISPAVVGAIDYPVSVGGSIVLSWSQFPDNRQWFATGGGATWNVDWGSGITNSYSGYAGPGAYSFLSAAKDVGANIRIFIRNSGPTGVFNICSYVSSAAAYNVYKSGDQSGAPAWSQPPGGINRILFSVQVIGNIVRITGVLSPRAQALQHPETIPESNQTSNLEGPHGANGESDGAVHSTGTDPIRYSSGEIDLQVTDISTSGFSPWSVSRSYTNLRDFGAVSFGTQWYLDQMPFIVDASTHFVVQFSALSSKVFTKLNATTNTPLRYELQTLNPVGTDLIFTDGIGNRWIFYDFTNSAEALRGKLRAYQDAGGNQTVIGYNATFQPITATRSATDTSGAAVSEQFVYAWNAAGLLSNVSRVVTRAGVATTVRQVSYDYYTGATTDFGAVNQLRSATVKDGSGVALEVDYYRYWKTGDTYIGGAAVAPAAIGQLKYVVSPRAYARLKPIAGDPLTTTISNAIIQLYATKYFEYDANNRVTKQVLRGDGTDASGTQTYAYSVNPHTVAQNYNLWTWKTIETLPDGTTNTIYGNYAGATVGFATRESVAPNRTWIHAYRYDTQGREIWHATPSAVTGVTETADDLGLTGAITANAPNVSDTTGLIESSDFAPATTATTAAAGDVAGLRRQRRIQQGELGTIQVVNASSYLLHTGN